MANIFGMQFFRRICALNLLLHRKIYTKKIKVTKPKFLVAVHFPYVPFNNNKILRCGGKVDIFRGFEMWMNIEVRSNVTLAYFQPRCEAL